MEYFYRGMRRKTGLLMTGGEPEGGQWNFDADNRKPARAGLFMPRPRRVEPDAITCEVLELVEQRFSGHFGDLQPFWLQSQQKRPKPRLSNGWPNASPRLATIGTPC